MPHFFVNSTLILVGIIGLFVISLMLFSYRSNIFVNIYLVIIFILCSIRSVSIGLFEIINTNSILTSRYISPIYLIVVPSLYLYFKSLTKDYERVYKKDLIHFLYPISNLVLNLVQEYFPILKNQSIENIRFISLNVFVLVYMIQSCNVLYNGLWRLDVNKFVEKRHYLLIKNWTLFIFTISSFLFLRILYSIYSEKISGELLRAQNYSFLVVIPWFLIYGKILIHPEILYGYPDLKRRDIETLNQISINDHVWIFNSIHASNLKDTKVCDNIEKRVLPYISDIENFVNKEHPFRNTKFSFPDFAKEINIPKCHIYYIFKYHAIVTFEEYKNYCKIKDALKLIDEGYLNTLTLEGLSSKVGFSSYNLFFTSFKKLTKLAPKEYLNRQNNLNLQNSDIIVFN